MINRGDVVIARFPYAGGTGHKVRPAVVIQCDRLNRQLHDTLLALVTGNTRLVGREPAQFLIGGRRGLIGWRSRVRLAAFSGGCGVCFHHRGEI